MGHEFGAKLGDELLGRQRLNISIRKKGTGAICWWGGGCYKMEVVIGGVG